MTSSTAFPFAGFLHRLEAHAASNDPAIAPVLASMLDGAGGELTSKAQTLIALLRARQSLHVAAVDTGLAADELRRYQKFAKPGQPSPHIVQLRQKQASARQASSQSRQRFNQAAAAFVREAGIEVPPRTALEMFVIRWIELHIPKDAAEN